LSASAELLVKIILYSTVLFCTLVFLFILLYDIHCTACYVFRADNGSVLIMHQDDVHRPSSPIKFHSSTPEKKVVIILGSVFYISAYRPRIAVKLQLAHNSYLSHAYRNEISAFRTSRHDPSLSAFPRYVFMDYLSLGVVIKPLDASLGACVLMRSRKRKSWSGRVGGHTRRRIIAVQLPPAAAEQSLCKSTCEVAR